MKIIIENHGETHVFESKSDDLTLPNILQKFCYLLIASGWHQESIVRLFNVEDAKKLENDPFKWEVYS